MRPNVAKCALLARVLVADGMVTPSERALLDSVMAEHRLTPEERRLVSELEGFAEATELLSALPADEKSALMAWLLEAASADNQLSALEVAELKRITGALNG